MPGILTDQIIRASVESGAIRIDPFNPAHVNPTSVDLTLGDEVAIYEDWVETYDTRGETSPTEDGRHFVPRNRIVDVRQEPRIEKFKIDPERGWLLLPKIGYLMHTRERVWTDKYVPILDGKSSIGRLFLQVHATAGYGDPGFDGHYTLEVIVQHPLRVFPGMRICQIRFHTTHGEVEKTYDKVGHYTGEAAVGAVGSQAWKQFREKA